MEGLDCRGIVWALPDLVGKRLEEHNLEILSSKAYVLIATEESLNEAQDQLRLAVNSHKPVVILYTGLHYILSVRSDPVFTQIADKVISIDWIYSDSEAVAAKIDAIIRSWSRNSALQAAPDVAGLETSSNKSAPQVEVLDTLANKSAAEAQPDVFISYAAEDAEQAQKLAEAIEACGWRVWWDRTLVPGVDFREEIERQLGIVKCVVVLWSKQSIEAHFVLDEAGYAMERKVLVQVLIEGVAPPFGFRQQHYADLTKWNGEAEAAGFPRLRRESRALCRPSRREVRVRARGATFTSG